MNGNLSTQTPENIAPPQIVAQPQPQVVQPGELASFFIVAADTRGLTYQWRTNGVNFPGATSDALLLTNVSALNQGLYSVVLSNSSGSITSAPAMLWIDSDGDDLPDSWELTYFGNLNQNPTGHSDGDGVSNLDEFLDGTNPTNSASAFFRLSLSSDGGVVGATPTRLTYTNGEVVSVTATSAPPEAFRFWTGTVNSRSNSIMLVMTNNQSLFAHFHPVTFRWTNSASGDWHNPLNWSPNLIPSAADDIAPLPNLTFTINQAGECHNVSLGGGTITGTGTLTIYGDAAWSSGTMSGAGRTIIAPGASLAINSAGVSLSQRTLENEGAMTLAGGGSISFSAAVITNGPAGVFNIENNSAFNLGGSVSRVDNSGTLRKIQGTGTTTFASGVNLNNYGNLEIQTGTLQMLAALGNAGNMALAPGTTLRITAGGSGSGSISNPPTSLVEWPSGSFTLSPGAQLNGAGLYRISGIGFVTCDADLTVENLDLSYYLTGSGQVTVSNVLNWTGTGGAMSGTGKTIIAPSATLNIANGGTVELRRGLENAGTTYWTGGGQISFISGFITNAPGALFQVQNASSFTFGGGVGCRFDNAGMFRKSSNSGTLTFPASVAFNNYGTTELQTGTLQFSGSLVNGGLLNLSPGTTARIASGGSGSGIITNPPTSLVEWPSGSFTLSPGAQLNGAGLYRISGIGFMTCNADLTVDNLNSSYYLSGSGRITINNVMNWTAGEMSGTGKTIIAPSATLNIANGGTVELRRGLENAGTTYWTGGGQISLISGFVTNAPGALFQVQSASSFVLNGGSGCRFDNAGTFRKLSNTGTTTIGSSIPFNNYGTVDIRSGILSVSGGYTPASNSLVNCALGGTTPGTGHGQLRRSGTTITLNGALNVELLPGFTPATNDTFTVVSAGTRSGTFNNFTYPSNRVAMTLSNSTSSVILRVTEVFPVPQPVLLTPQLVASNALLTWTATSNVTYRLEQNGDASLTNWTAVPGDVTTLSNTASKLDALTPSNRLYRVRALP